MRDLKFLLIGGGEQDSELRNLVQDLGIQNHVVFTGYIKYQDLPKYLKVADVAVNTLETTLVANVALPNKVLQYMAVGLPVVSTKLEGLYSVFENQEGIAWAKDVRSVIRGASQLVGAEIVEPRQTSRVSSHSSLSMFEPGTALDKFESVLGSIAESGLK
jgi:glycosyltransferase involved in cell wall biosynthesis